MNTRRNFIQSVACLSAIKLNDPPPNNNGWRNLFIEINEQFYRIALYQSYSGNYRYSYEVVNVGNRPNDGTGDTIEVALIKILDNLKKLPLCLSK